MTYVTWKVEHYPYDSNTWSTTATELTKIHDLSITVNLGDAKDTFNIKVINFDNDYTDYFNSNDKVLISRAVNTTTVASSDAIILGTIANIPEDVDGKKNLIRLEGVNFTDSVLQAVALFDPKGVDIPTAIQRALTAVQTYNSNFAVTWHSSNPTLTTAGSAFPTVAEEWFNKPIIQFIQKYSSKKETTDTDYYFYVDKDNKFVWRPKVDAATAAFSATTSPYRMMRITKDLKDVKNWVMVRGGKDPLNKPVQAPAYNITSIAKHGVKPTFLTSQAKYIESQHAKDLAAQGVRSLADMTFPYTPSWSTVSCSSSNDYVDKLRAYVKALLRAEGEVFLSKSSFGKLKVDLVFYPGDVSWILGTVVACTIPSISSTAKNMRVTEINYSTDADTFTLIEDEGSL